MVLSSSVCMPLAAISVTNVGRGSCSCAPADEEHWRFYVLHDGDSCDEPLSCYIWCFEAWWQTVASTVSSGCFASLNRLLFAYNTFHVQGCGLFGLWFDFAVLVIPLVVVAWEET